MGIIAKQSSAGAGLQAPEGVHRAACVGIYDVGTQESYDPKYSPKRRVVLVWELVDEHLPDGRPFVVSAEYTLSLHERASLRHLLESWRGRAFTEAELAGFDLADVLGRPCQVQVILSDKGYARVASVIKFGKGLQPIRETSNKPTLFGLDDQEGEVAFPDAMPEWLRNKVRQSPEYRSIVDGEVVPDAGDDDDLPF